MSEPRRSVRSTKGQNSRLSEINAEPPPTPAPKPKKKKAQPQQTSPEVEEHQEQDENGDKSDDIIRCVCGAKEEDEDDERMMIQCEGCDAWQHTQCMGIPKKKIPKQYFCEICKPENHRYLLEQMEAGERPWEKKHRGGRKPAAAKGRRKSTPSEAKAVQTPAKAPAQAQAPASAPPAPVPVPPFKTEPMDIDHPPVPQAAPVAPAIPQTQQAVVDRDATLSATEDMPPPSQVKVEKLHSPAFPSESQAPTGPAQKPKGKRDTTAHQPEAAVKRKADSDGEYQAEDEKHSDKKHRRIPSAQSIEHGTQQKQHAPTTTTTERRRSSAGTPKTPKVKKQEEGPPQMELVSSVTELRNGNRRNVISYLLGVLIDRAKHLAFQEGTLPMREGQTVEGITESLSLQVEHHTFISLCKAGEITPDYTHKMRSIGFNVKKNKDLSDGLLCGHITPEQLAHMTTEEMASKELKELNQKLRLESEKQHTLINTETGPRIRRTHKGEELVDEPTAQNGQDTILGTGNMVRRMTTDFSDHSPAPAAQEKSPSAPATETPPTVTAPSEPPHSPRAPTPAAAPKPPAIDTKVPEKQGRSFSIENIWSHVESPDQDRVPRQIRPPVQTPVSTVDKDIDNLLKEDHEDDAGTPPYSPASFDDHYSPRAHDDIPTDSWHGNIEMNGVSNLNATATLLGGPEVIGDWRWHDLLDTTLVVDGRIKHDRATEYLCGQKYSRSSAMVVASVKPVDSSSQYDFDKLFEYFKKKERYAVVGKHSQPLIKDIYLAPIEPDAKLPDWFNALDHPHHVPAAGRSGRMLVLIFVVLRSNGPGATPTPTAGRFPTPTPPQQFSPAAPTTSATPQPQHPTAFGTPGQQHHAAYGTPVQPQASPYVPPPPQPQQPHGYPQYGPAPPQPQLQQQQAQPHPQIPTLAYQPQHPLTKQLLLSMPDRVTMEQLRATDQVLLERPELATDPAALQQVFQMFVNGNAGGGGDPRAPGTAPGPGPQGTPGTTG